MTIEEKKFIRDWEFQKSGKKWKYYLQYIIAWSSVIFLSSFFLVKLIMEDRYMSWTMLFIILPSSILLASLITHLVYETNEKKLKRILEREKGANGV